MEKEKVKVADISGSGMLDGMSFSSKLGPAGKPADVDDILVFQNGMFVSKECEIRCNYPARPYYVRPLGDKIAFISETRCPDKDAKIVWRGTVDQEKIQGVYTWTISRWYWTVEKEFWFSGNLTQQSEPIAGN